MLQACQHLYAWNSPDFELERRFVRVTLWNKVHAGAALHKEGLLLWIKNDTTAPSGVGHVSCLKTWAWPLPGSATQQMFMNPNTPSFSNPHTQQDEINENWKCMRRRKNTTNVEKILIKRLLCWRVYRIGNRKC